MNAFRCLRAVARPGTTASALLRPSIGRIAAPQKHVLPSSARSISLLAPRRPMLPSPSTPLATASTTSSSAAPSSIGIRAFSATALMGGPRDTYNPSHLVRKRRHGFLSRLKTKKGRKTLMRRIKKGRHYLSH